MDAGRGRGGAPRAVRAGLLALVAVAARALRVAPLALLGLVACGGEGGDGGADEGPTTRGAFAGADIVLISLDTLRADDVSPYGAAPALSPVLQAFAEEAVLFEHARAQAPQTAPSHMSLFTSMYPSAHGVQNVQHGVDPETGRRGPLIEAVPDSIPTLAQVLSAAGYRSIGLTDGGNLNAAHGFPRGFEEYTLDLSGGRAQLEDGKRWVAELAAGEQPFFLFWHTYEIHAPYVSPGPYVDRWAPKAYDGVLAGVLDQLEGLDFKRRFAAMKSVFWKDKADFGWDESAYLHGLYRAGVQYTDELMGELFESLRASGAFDESIIVVLSDHGEEFYEHGQWQHDQVYEECLRVPLMIRLPGGVGGGTRIETPVALMDVMPTLLELVDVSPSVLDDGGPAAAMRPRMQGHSLARALLTAEEPEARPIYSEYRADRPGGPLFDWQIAIHHEGWKFIVDEVRGEKIDGEVVQKHELYDLGADPDEQQDAADGQDVMVQRFLRLREEYKRGLDAFAELERLDAGATLDEATLRSLVELGYIDGSALQGLDGGGVRGDDGD